MSKRKLKLIIFLLVGVLLGGAAGYAMIPGPPKGVTLPLVAPGEKDPYYAFLSGGKGGDVRVFGAPSMRLIKVIPVFSPNASYGYAGPADANRSLLGQSGGARWGDTLFPVLSKTGGNYDGKHLFVQDQAHARVARIDLDAFETKAIAQLPNMQTAQAIAVDPETKYLFVGGQATGQTGRGMISFTDPVKLQVGFQVLGPNVNMLDGGKDGQHIFGAVPGANGQGGGVAIYSLKAIQQAVNDGKVSKIGNVPVADANQVSGLVDIIPVPGQVTEVSVSPDGKYVVAGGMGTKATVIDIANKKVVAELNLGPDPRYTVFDGRGHAYTAVYSDSKVVEWDVAKAVSGKGEGQGYVMQSLAVQSNPVYLDLGDGRTAKPSGQLLLVYNQGGSDRFVNVHNPVQNTQVVDISGPQMKLLLDGSVEPTVTDGVEVAANTLKPLDVFTPGPEAVPEGQSKVVRNGNRVDVYLTAKRSEFGMDNFKVQQGDHVYLHVTNIERTKDITHGFAINEYNVALSIPPGKTVEADFIADKPGVYWYYCTIFCSALHMEMHGQMTVEPKQ